MLTGVLSEESDEVLARAAAVGDGAAFDELTRRLLPLVLRYVQRMVPNPQVAADITQETMLAAWRGLPRFGFRSSVRTWVFSVAHNKVTDFRRQRGEEPVASDELAELPTRHDHPESAAMASSMLAALEQELAALPHHARACWWLREMEGLSHPEIGAILNLGSGQVRGHLQRTRATLARRMAPWRPDSQRYGKADSPHDNNETVHPQVMRANGIQDGESSVRDQDAADATERSA